ncbi:MAG TPA: aminotransferase class I/II-fold pyridoxal phosphate-dependent enzyme [Terriglobia bacterium]|nr:aminotransferase class I/II-fold pyridoxal phosphate-dependent enzyme [Terriglobia bacterium]
MKIETFEMERWQSQWENVVEYNLAESGVDPLTVEELLGGADAVRELGRQKMLYNQGNGTPELRDLIAKLYPGADRDNVVVTHGTCEANYLAIWSLVQPGDEVVMMLPNYMQIWGLARGFGARVTPFRLREEAGWEPDLDELRRAVTSCTKLIAVCNPNNPTGSVLSETAMDEIVAAARRAGAWLLADEVYQGAEVSGQTTPSFWGRYEKTIVNNGLSKAYGLPGLRIGWTVGPKDLIYRFWSYKDYTTIASSVLSDVLARRALEPATRQRILERTRSILRRNYPVIEDWIANHGRDFSMVPPAAGAIAYLRYRHAINSSQLMERCIRERSLLIVPGDHFGMDGFIRLNYGVPADHLREGLARLDTTLSTVAKSGASAAQSAAGCSGGL